jgi:PhzF family phenazine biosynthesis protein
MIKTYVYGRTLAMQARRFIQCDVFSPLPTQGNGLAVIVDAEGLSDDQMQRFAAWTNLAETTFLLPPTVADADYKVRILTPVREMLFAGHPTLVTRRWSPGAGHPTLVTRRWGVARHGCTRVVCRRTPRWFAKNAA